MSTIDAPVVSTTSAPTVSATNTPVSQASTGFVARGGASWIGWTMALVAIFAFSTATPIARAALLIGLHPYALLAGRMSVALTLMAATILLLKPSRLRLPRKAILIAFGAGILNSGGLVCYFLGLTYLEASMAAMIISLSPMILLSILALRGERVTSRHVVRLVLALSGVYLLIGPSGDVSLVGVFFVLSAIVAFGLQTALIQWYLSEYDGLAVIFYILFSMTVGILLWWLIQGAPWQDPGVNGWAAILGLAVIGTFAARLLHFGAVARIGGGQTSMLAPLETFLAVIWAYIFLHERLYPVQLIGGTLILLSAVLAVQRLRRGRLHLRFRLWPRT